MLGNHPSIEIPQSTEYAKEMRKWESQASRFGQPGRPYTFQQFPMRMSKAAHVAGKGIEVTEELNANDQSEVERLQARGFHFGHEKAFAAARAEQTEHGKLAASREYDVRHGKHSERAVEEIRNAEAEHGSRHLPAVPETPIPATGKKRGPKPKALAPTS